MASLTDGCRDPKGSARAHARASGPNASNYDWVPMKAKTAGGTNVWRGRLLIQGPADRTKRTREWGRRA